MKYLSTKYHNVIRDHNFSTHKDKLSTIRDCFRSGGSNTFYVEWDDTKITLLDDTETSILEHTNTGTAYAAHSIHVYSTAAVSMTVDVCISK